MGLFEQYPWMLVVLIVVTIEAWSLAKQMLRRLLSRSRSEQLDD